MNERTRNVIVGATALLGLAGLALLLVLFGGLPNWLNKGYAVTVELPQAGGLTKSSRVKLSGIDIGEIESVQFQPLPKRGVKVVLRIDKDQRIPRDAQATVFQPLFTGSPALHFNAQTLSDEQMLKTLATDGSATVQGTVPSIKGPMDSLKAELRGPIDQFARMETRFNELVQAWTQVGSNIEKLTAPQTVDQVDSGEAAANLPGFLARADQRIGEMKQVLEAARTWIDRMEETSANVGKAATSVDKAAAQARSDFERLTRRYIAVADDLSALIRDTRNAVTKATDGDGTMGKLLNDPSLYENLNDSAERIGQAMDEIKLMIQKWNTEGVPVQF